MGPAICVEALNFEERKAYVKSVDVDYYTDAIRYTQVRVLEISGHRRVLQRPALTPMRPGPTATCWCARR